MATVKILLRESKINKVGEAPLCIRITKNRKSKFVFLNYRIKPDFWDDENKRVRKSHPNAQQLNRYIAIKLMEAQEAALMMEAADKAILPERIKEQIMGKAPVPFFKFADRYVEELKVNLKVGSHRKTKSVVTKMKKYVGGRELFFEHITVAWLKDYAKYLKSEHENKTNTVSCNFRTIRRIINLAICEDLIEPEKNPFKKFRLVTEKVKKEFLTDEELMLIELAPLEKGSEMDHHRNMFVFSAYSGGLRISDMLNLRWKNFDGERVLVQTRKTASIVSIKLPSKALEILAIYRGADVKPEDFIFPVLDNAVDYSDPYRMLYAISKADGEINDSIRAILKIINLDKKITFHSARHSFAVRALRKGVRIEYVSKLLGHASISTTQIYAQVVNEELDKAMEVFE